MDWINRLFPKKEKGNLLIFDARLSLNDNELTKFQKTDVLLDFVNVPFATLTESKMTNAWYFEHIDKDYVFHLTANGFKISKYASKKALFNNNLNR